MDCETNLHAALARVTGYNGCFSFFSTRRIIKFIEEFKPNVIHIHELHAYFVNYVPLIEYIKTKKIPVVWTFHCEYMYTGKCGYAFDCEKWKTGCGHCPSVKDYPKSLYFDHTKEMYQTKKRVLEDFDFTIVTPSRWLADRVGQSFLKHKAIHVIHNGIDSENVFYPRGEEETKLIRQKYDLSEKKIVLCVAPNIMDERKGGKQVLLLAEKMNNIQFVMVGADENIKYNDNVFLVKRTRDQEELAKWYSLADLFLICSKKENFPTTCLEALCCGTPIVGIDEGGTKETCPNQFGKFVDNKTELLQKEIIDQINMNYSRDEIRKFAVKIYSKDVMCESYKTLYCEILETSLMQSKTNNT